jgi:hypothetical protein
LLERRLEMAVTVKKVTLWRKEVAHEPGVLADVLEPLAEAGANLRVVMGYAIPGRSRQAAVELFPVTGPKAIRAAKGANLAASPISCLLVEGDDRSGLGATMARAVAAAGINISFLMAEVIGRKFSAVFGFESDGDAASAARAIKAATKAPKKLARKRR